MKRRDFSLTLAICGSVLAHAAVTEFLAEMYINRAGRVYLPGFPLQYAASVAPADVDEPKLGDDKGAGDATDDSSGALPQEAQQADHAQAFLGLDPQGVKAKSNSAADAWHAAAPPPTVAPSNAAASAAPFGVPGTDADVRSGLADAKPSQTAQQESDERESNAAADAQPQPQEMSEPSSPAAPTGAPAEQAETESDPVSVVASAKFRPGKTEIEYGRAHKITRPHLSLAAQADMMTIAGPALTLKITIDATGHVQNVVIFKSSGSSNIDEGCKLAAYDWWFEPAKDHAGKARGDVILFGIRFI